MKLREVIAFNEIDKITATLDLPRYLARESKYLYKKLSKQGVGKGRLTESVVAAVVYICCRNNHIPHTLDEVEKASGIPKKEIGRVFKFINRNMTDLKVTKINPVEYIPRFCCELRVSLITQELAKRILQEAIKERREISGSLLGYAAGAIYIACSLAGERRTQKEVANVVGVTETLVRNRQIEIRQRVGKRLSDCVVGV